MDINLRDRLHAGVTPFFWGLGFQILLHFFVGVWFWRDEAIEAVSVIHCPALTVMDAVLTDTESIVAPGLAALGILALEVVSYSLIFAVVVAGGLKWVLRVVAVCCPSLALRRESWRRWSAYLLAAFAAVIAVCAVALPVVRQWRERHIARFVEDCGGRVSRTQGFVDRVKLDGVRISPEGLRRLESLDHLRHLDLSNSEITAEHLAVVAELSDLSSLYLRKTGIGDNDLERLADAPQLETIILGDTNITDQGLRQLRIHKHLTTLYVDGTQIGDAGAAELATLTQLRNLNLRGTQITDAGVRHLAPLKELWYLELTYCEVGDSSTDVFNKMPLLRNLYLSGAGITDSGLNDLAEAPSLEVLELVHTSVTLDGVKAFEAKRPDLIVLHDLN